MMPNQFNSFRLRQTLQVLFAAQARDVAGRLRLADVLDGAPVPDLTHWNKIVADACKPLLLPAWQSGVIQSTQRVARLLGKPDDRRRVLSTADIFRPQKGVMWSDGEHPEKNVQPACRVTKANRVAEHPLDAGHPTGWSGWPVRKAAGTVGVDWAWFNPKINDAVDDATMQFCRGTNATATRELGQAVALLRRKLKAGLERGEAVRLLTRSVVRIFADPFRAARITATEVSRAVNGGALLAAKENPQVKKKQWLPSSDACPECLELDGKEVALDAPFYVDPKGGPYAVVQAPPLHPFCMCTWTEVL